MVDVVASPLYVCAELDEMRRARKGSAAGRDGGGPASTAPQPAAAAAGRLGSHGEPAAPAGPSVSAAAAGGGVQAPSAQAEELQAQLAAALFKAQGREAQARKYKEAARALKVIKKGGGAACMPGGGRASGAHAPSSLAGGLICQLILLRILFPRQTDFACSPCSLQARCASTPCLLAAKHACGLRPGSPLHAGKAVGVGGAAG